MNSGRFPLFSMLEKRGKDAENALVIPSMQFRSTSVTNSLQVRSNSNRENGVTTEA